MDYLDKYLKYKNKYLHLKKTQNDKQIGGQNYCINNCGRFSYRNFPTCCQACISRNGPHTADCNQRNAQVTQRVPQPIQHLIDTILLIPPTPSRKSVDINSTSSLISILSNIQIQISQLPNYQPARMGFHIELVDNAADIMNKNNNYNAINNKQIDLCSKSNWYCEGGAFSLLIGSYPGHNRPIHITIGYFGNYQNCQNILISAQNIVENILNKKLH